MKSCFAHAPLSWALVSTLLIGMSPSIARSLSEDPPTAKKPAPVVLTGRVSFEGPRPQVRALPSTPAQTKGCCPADAAVNVSDPGLVIDAKNGLANVLVTVDVPGAKAVVSDTPFVLDQRSCVFEPHCLIVTAGSKVVFKNSDTVSHNVHVYSARNDGSNDVVAAGAQLEKTYAKPDKIKIACDYHPWMSSFLLVVDTPWCTLTKSDGTFQFAGLPAGTWKVKLWHETLGRAEAQATVKADGTCTVLDLTMSMPAKKG